MNKQVIAKVKYGHGYLGDITGKVFTATPIYNREGMLHSYEISGKVLHHASPADFDYDNFQYFFDTDWIEVIA